MFLEDNTIRAHYECYVLEGIDGLLKYDYVKPLCYLELTNLDKLDKHLQSNMYMHSKDIRLYIEKTFKVTYTLEGVRALLKQLNFVYKKTKHLPGKGDLEKQKALEYHYYSLKASEGKQDDIYFMDGVHPLHNSMLGNGWIKKGQKKQ